jgi:hypothetical protein
MRRFSTLDPNFRVAHYGSDRQDWRDRLVRHGKTWVRDEYGTIVGYRHGQEKASFREH